MEVNTQIQPSVHPMPDCQLMLEQMEGQHVYSTLDLKVGYENIPIAPSLQWFCLVVTQDGLYQLHQMTFSFNTGLAHF